MALPAVSRTFTRHARMPGVAVGLSPRAEALYLVLRDWARGSGEACATLEEIAFALTGRRAGGWVTDLVRELAEARLIAVLPVRRRVLHYRLLVGE